jgi:hypothetical protein
MILCFPTMAACSKKCSSAASAVGVIMSVSQS